MTASKYDEKTAKQICKLIEKDSYTISEICEKVNIGVSTYYQWREAHPQFLESVKIAQENRKKGFAELARKSLKKLVEGFEYEEVKTEEEEGLEVRRTVVKKTVKPDTAAVIFTLCNTDPENWKNRQNTDLTTGGDKLNKVTVVTTDKHTEENLDKLEE